MTMWLDLSVGASNKPEQFSSVQIFDHIFPCNGDFPCIQGGSLYTPRVGIQGKSLQVKPLKVSHESTPHSINSIDCGRNFGREWLALPEVEQA